jgi:AcrR family transcriptional regulator
MSRKSAPAKLAPARMQKKSSPRKTDRRVRRTRDALGDALVALMHEKPFDQITVQHVLDRAKVGRSTFYTHFVDKEDLFLSDVDEFFQMMAGYLSRKGEASTRVAPVREMFAHVADTREFQAALVASGQIHEVLQLAQGHFAKGIEQRLAEIPQSRGIAPAARAVMAQAAAGAMLSLMSWWIDRGSYASSEQMDAVFHHLVWSGMNSGAAQMPSAPKKGKPRPRKASIPPHSRMSLFK